MKTFEEKFTAWLDGMLGGDELRSFENEHPSIQRGEGRVSEAERPAERKSCLGGNLRIPIFSMPQIMEQIRREAGATSRSARRPVLGLPRLAWGGICALSLGFVLFFTMIPRGDLSDPHAKYVAEVLKTKTADPKRKATVENQKRYDHYQARRS